MTRLEAAAREALAAYKAIGMGTAGWNARDRIAFSELEAALAEIDPEPAAPARRRSWPMIGFINLTNTKAL